MCCEKASASPLARVFSTTNPAFAQRINPVLFSVFLFDSFVPTHLALRANLRLLYRAPAPVLGCVYLGNPWLKFLAVKRRNPFTRHAARVSQVPALQAGLGGGELMGDQGKFYPLQKYKFLL